jgi:hypothetical protein
MQPIAALFVALAPALAQTPNVNGAGPGSLSVDTARYARVIYVSVGHGSDSGDGSRARPWKSVARALAAAGNGGRTAILVAEGRYAEATVRMKTGTDLYGGFEDGSWRRDTLRRPAVLDGQGERRVLMAADDARLDGFTVRGGRVRGKGAGLLCEGASPVISNCVFTGNETLAPADWKPAAMHEVANDGGAIAVLNRSRAVIEHNLIARNTTECGRGGGIAIDGQSSPLIANNVIVENRTGTKDPRRSSDGGGISVYDRSIPEIRGNIIALNRSAASNDAGGIFVALWSSPRIVSNVIAGNWGDDDGGALFIGGQQHHYGTPLDPVPDENAFLVRVHSNLIAGNDNSSHNAGVARVTMQSRVEFRDNIMFHNRGGLRIQSSGAAVTGNAIADPVAVMNDSKGSRDLPGPVVVKGNLLAGKAAYEMDVVSIGNCDARAGQFGAAAAGKIVAVEPLADSLTTMVRSDAALQASPGSVIRAGRSWTVVRAVRGGAIEVWGAVHEAPVDFELFSFPERPACGGTE